MHDYEVVPSHKVNIHGSDNKEIRVKVGVVLPCKLDIHGSDNKVIPFKS